MNADAQESTTYSDGLTLGEVGRALIRIERKLDDLTHDHERRLRAVERALWAATGIGGAGLASGMSALLQAFLNR
jgi:hypothetical protein